MGEVIVFIVRWWAPLRERHGEAVVGAAEGFERDSAAVIYVGQGAADGGPVEMAGAEEASVVFVGLEVDHVRAGVVDGLAEIVFLHIHMEGVEHHADRG